jgi:hypothetical protein
MKARHSVSERGPVGGIRGMAGHRAGGGEEVSVGCPLPQYISAVRVVAKSFFDGQEGLTANRMPILQALLRAYGQ